MNTVVEIGNLLSQVDLHGVSSLQEDKIEALERYIQDCNEAMNGDGEKYYYIKNFQEVMKIP